MNDAQVDRLLKQLSDTQRELAATRVSFELANDSFQKAIGQIKWNKTNTVIQYILIVLVFLMGALGVNYYTQEKSAACSRGNILRVELELPLREC